MEKIEVIHNKCVVPIGGNYIEFVLVNSSSDSDGYDCDVGNIVQFHGGVYSPRVVVRPPIRQDDDVFSHVRSCTMTVCRKRENTMCEIANSSSHFFINKIKVKCNIIVYISPMRQLSVRKGGFFSLQMYLLYNKSIISNFHTTVCSTEMFKILQPKKKKKNQFQLRLVKKSHTSIYYIQMLQMQHLSLSLEIYVLKISYFLHLWSCSA